MQTSFKTSRALLVTALLGLGIAACDTHTSPAPATPSSGSSAQLGTPSPSTQPGAAPASPIGGGPNMASAGPSGAMNDTAITGKVKAAFSSDDMLKGASIDVTTDKGNVALTGTVDTQAQAYHAADLARAVGGVQSVDNRLAAKKTG